MEKLSDEVLEKSAEYFEEYVKEHGRKSYVWVKNEETGELVIYAKGKKAERLRDFLKMLR